MGTMNSVVNQQNNQTLQSSNQLSNQLSNQQSIQQSIQQWKLLELVQLSPDAEDADAGAPLQLLKYSGSNPDQQGPLLVLAGFRGAAQNDGRILQLLQKAISSSVIRPVSDIFLCPVINPSSRSRNSYLNKKGQDILNDFPTQKNTAASDMNQSAEVTTLLRWIGKIKPKAILSLLNEEATLSSQNCPSEIVGKLHTLSERPIVEIGEKLPSLEPAVPVTDPQLLADMEEHHNFDKNLGQWCLENEIIWINFSVDSVKKTFEDVREDWKLNLGPAIKWLLEGPRFNPPVEEPLFITPAVIPSVELPPELMNL